MPRDRSQLLSPLYFLVSPPTSLFLPSHLCSSTQPTVTYLSSLPNSALAFLTSTPIYRLEQVVLRASSFQLSLSLKFYYQWILPTSRPIQVTKLVSVDALSWFYSAYHRVCYTRDELVRRLQKRAVLYQWSPPKWVPRLLELFFRKLRYPLSTPVSSRIGNEYFRTSWTSCFFFSDLWR